MSYSKYTNKNLTRKQLWEIIYSKDDKIAKLKNKLYGSGSATVYGSEDELELPMSITADDIEVVDVEGTDFDDMETRIKSSIASILSQGSVDDWAEAVERIAARSTEKVGRRVHVISCDDQPNHNQYCIDPKSSINFMVKDNL